MATMGKINPKDCNYCGHPTDQSKRYLLQECQKCHEVVTPIDEKDVVHK